MEKILKRGIVIFIIALFVLQLILPVVGFAANQETLSTTQFAIIDNYIYKVPGKTEVSTFLQHISADSGAECVVYDGTNIAASNAIVKTGMKLKVGESTTYTIIVRGDVNKDGQIMATDLSQLKSHMVGLSKLDDLGSRGADINLDGKLTAVDLSQLKMILVGLPLPDVKVNVTGDIVINVKTTSYSQQLLVTVTWPENIDGLTKQLSIDGGKTFTNNIDEATITENTTVVARLLDAQSRVVKIATLEITNIDIAGPAAFELSYDHRISNYITVSGTTTDTESGINTYYFSRDGGETWEPVAGKVSGIYKFTDLASDSTVSLRMKAVDNAGNEVLTPTVDQRTFTSGIEILKNEFGTKGITIDEENLTLTLPDERIYKLIINENGGYVIKHIGDEDEAEEISAEEVTLNQVVKEYEENGALTAEAILERLTEEKYGNAVMEDLTLIIEHPEYYNIYRINTLNDGTHSVIFNEKVKKANLTVTGQMSEQEVLDQIEVLLNEMNEAGTTSIIEALDRFVEEDLVLEECVNKNLGRFEGETGLVYEISHDSNGDLQCMLIGSAEEVDNGLIAEAMLEAMRGILQNEVIDWVIEDGITTESLADRANGGYTITSGAYKQVVIDFEQGTYEVVDAQKPEGAKITYTLTPEFPTMTNKIELGITAEDTNGISKLQIISTIGEVLFEKNYTGQTTVNETFDITENGWITVKVTSADGKIAQKKIIISHIGTLLPIKVTINPESPRNTTAVGIQNNIVTGPISVTLRYSEALILSNTDKYQYQINSTTGEWTVADLTEVIDGITENCSIYARYVDEEGNALKQIEIVIDNVDNIAPEAFEYTTIVTSHSIVVNAETTDTAADSAGNPARENVAGIETYKYSLDGENWQTDNVFENLTQTTEYTVYAKAIDYAGNETVATNNGTTIQTKAVAKASEYVEFAYSTTELTKDPVTVTMSMSDIDDTSYILEYQFASDESELDADLWIKGSEFITPDNVKMFVRIKDVTGQVSLTGDYAIGEVANIDNLAPEEFTPELIASTYNSLTLNASDANGGVAVDAAETPQSLSSGIASYVYYLIPTSGEIVKTEPTNENSVTFSNLTSGSLYNVYVEATDNAGNIRMSRMIAVATNAKVGEYVQTPTTITDLFTEFSYDNPLIPTGFMPVDTATSSWGDGTTKASGVNEGLLIQDEDQNEFIWVPVDGETIKYQKTGSLVDGENPEINGEEIDDVVDVENKGGFYIARYEAGKVSGDAVSAKGENPYTLVRYDIAKEKAEAMYEENHNVQGALINGTQWDTLMSWIESANVTEEPEESEDPESSQEPQGPVYDTTNSTSWGNYSGEKAYTGSSENYKVKNIYDLAGNVQEITNEISGEDVIVRGGAYDNTLSAASRTTYSSEYVSENLGFRAVIYVVNENEYNPAGDGILGIGNYNEGPGNVTVNGAQGSYLNPVVPVGFRAINTTVASWNGITPDGWNAGLVIEDYDGNQFVWVPVNGTTVKYQKSYTTFAENDFSANIAGDDILALLAEIGEEERTQIDLYGGFYVARYEAGINEGQLGSKSGLKVVNGITYKQAKAYAEAMYDTPYVKSGLVTGTQWDTMTTWVGTTSGKSYVQSSTKDFGNNYWADFTFSGTYAEGPNSYLQTRGEYKTGTNVTKAPGTRMLLATGLVTDFRINNIYDLAGNVWEYTTEYTVENEVTTHVARGGDYYRVYSQSLPWGIGLREEVSVSIGEARNEGGLRVVLFLTSEDSELGQYEDYNRTLDGNPATYCNPVIPAGYAAVNKGAEWGSETGWNEGLVITDKAGNEFVWVPVDKTSVTYKKWLERGVSYKEVAGDEIPEVLENWDEKEKTQVSKYGGFYIARYETSISEDGIVQTMPNKTTLTDITYNEAKDLLEEYETEDTVAVGIVTGTQWDTTLRWIANELSEELVTTDSSSWGNYSNSYLGRNANAKNIYELAGGNWEITAELYETEDVVYRGGVYTDAGSSSPAGYRGIIPLDSSEDKTTFRMVLYITGAIEGIANSPVAETEPLPGTKFVTQVNTPELSAGMIPVKWNGSSWVETTVDDPEWYEYTDALSSGEGSSQWANAKTPDGSMWVWIPRYAYKINSGTKDIEIVFLNDTTDTPITKTTAPIYHKQDTTKGITTKNNFIVHPSFINDSSLGGWSKELTGYWVSKFQSSGSTKQTVSSKPSMSCYGNVNAGSHFTLAMTANLGLTSEQRKSMDSHMMKNTEWGAIAYLAYSNYGSVKRTIATNTTGKTGGSNYKTNVNQSTTGNVYGVYDTSSTVATYIASYVYPWSGVRYSNISNMDISNAKYRMRYASNYATALYGDAMNETLGWQGSKVQLLYNYGSVIDHSYWEATPAILRGDAGHGRSNDSIFSTSVQCGNSNFAHAMRMVIVNDTAATGVWNYTGFTKIRRYRWSGGHHEMGSWRTTYYYYSKCSLCGTTTVKTSRAALPANGTVHCIGGIEK